MKKLFAKKRWIILIILIIATSVGVWRWQGNKSPQETYRKVTVTRGDIQVTTLSTGTVQPENRLEIKPPVAGKMEKVLVREGEHVREGQILAWMSSTERAALLEAARARGEQEVAHWKELYKPTPLIAPITGTIIYRRMEPGQSITQADAALVMSDHLIIKAQVDETDIGQIRTGQPVDLALDAYAQHPFTGTVNRIAYEAKTVNNVTVYEVNLLPHKIPPFMRSGMTANVTFHVTSRKNILLIPSEAIRSSEKRSTVLIERAGSDNSPERRKITTGITDGKNTEILSGLAEGETILIPSFRMHADGEPSISTNPFSARRGRRR